MTFLRAREKVGFMDKAEASAVDEDRRFSTETNLPVDRDELRTEVQAKYAAVVLKPNDEFHFHTGR
jgi:hypothetical protein